MIFGTSPVRVSTGSQDSLTLRERGGGEPSWISSILPGECRDNTLKWVTTNYQFHRKTSFGVDAECNEQNLRTNFIAGDGKIWWRTKRNLARGHVQIGPILIKLFTFSYTVDYKETVM